MEIQTTRKVLHHFTCEGCGIKAESRRKVKAKTGLCRKCRRLEVSKNQMQMFELEGMKISTGDKPHDAL